jgi:AraC-like DNA-binding protein
MKSVCGQKNSMDRNLYLNNLWKLSGFKSKSIFNKHFEKTTGIGVSAYFDKISK